MDAVELLNYHQSQMLSTKHCNIHWQKLGMGAAATSKKNSTMRLA